MNKKARILAFYLPQFHPIPENDKWWGKGFTEWTNVGKAKPLFRGHYQPRVPADLGYYDLRLPEIRQAQADMARQYGVEGFCYWHYWFGNGKKLLERPFSEVLISGKPDFPFCLGWANHSWQGLICGVKGDKPLISQVYGGMKDYNDHFLDVLPAFQDHRYITVDDKPLFLVYCPFDLPDVRQFIDLWKNLAIENNLKGIHFVAHIYKPEDIQKALDLGFDSVTIIRMNEYQRLGLSFYRMAINKIKRDIFKCGFLCEYKDAMTYFSGIEDAQEDVYPTIIPNWDHSPRTGRNGTIFINSTPELFGKHVRKTLESVKRKKDQHKIVFLKSWNEWAEGNYMEPDLKFGKGYLEALKMELDRE